MRAHGVPAWSAGRLVALAALAVVLLWAAYLARWGILLVYISVLIATGVRPLAAWIGRFRIPGTETTVPRWLAAMAVYLLVLGLFAGIGAAVAPAMVEQGRQLAANWPSLLDQAQGFLVRHNLMEERKSPSEIMQHIPLGTGTAVLQQVWRLMGGLFGLFLILVLSLYLLHDARRLRDAAVAFLPRRRQAQVCAMLAEMTDRIGAWMMGQLMLSAIIGATTAIALGLLGVPYFFILAVIAAVGELVPYAGPIVAAVPGILIALTISPETALLVTAFYLAQQQLENHVLVPKLMQHEVGLMPSIVIVAITIGSMLLGVLGALIAVPTAAILMVAVSALRPPARA